MSHNSDSAINVNQPQRTCMTETTSYLNGEVKKENKVNSDVNIQSISQNLETNLVHGTDGFAENSAVSLNGAEVVESSSMILNQDDRIMYINTEGSVVFEPKEMASSSADHIPVALSSGPGGAVCLENTSSLNSNYLVVVENPRAAQALSSGFGGSIVMSSQPCETDANSSLASACPEDGGLKSSDSEHPHQQTIMVLDGQLQSDSILIDPGVLVAYDHTSAERVTFSPDPSVENNVRPLPELCQRSYIHLGQTTLADGTSNYTDEKSLPVLQKSHLSHNFSSAHAIVVAQNPLSATDSCGGKDSTGIDEAENIRISGMEDSKILQQKEELRMLERSHLQHHLKEAKKKSCNQLTTHPSRSFIKNKRKEPIEEISALSDTPSPSPSNESVDDGISVFSHITAKINADLLALIPGCQRFLLDKMEQSSPSSQLHMSFESDADCTFSGSLKSLIEVHNSLKKLLDAGDVSLLDFKMSRAPKKTCDRSVMCSLLQPFISSRGRQPKYSYKAKTMGFTSDFESLLKVDNDEDYDEGLLTSSSRFGKRKRGRPRKMFKKKVQRKENVCAHDYLDKNLPQTEESQAAISEACVLSPENAKNNLPDLTDPLQQKLFEEQIKYKKRLEKKTKETATQEVSSNTPLSQEASNEYEQVNPVGVKQVSPKSPEQINPGDSQQSQNQMNGENAVHLYFCSHCSFKTKRHSLYLIHMRCHEDGTEKTYHCKKCDFSSQSLSVLKRHEAKHKESLFRCNICATYQTDKKALLFRHVRIKHSIRIDSNSDLQCRERNFKASGEEELIQHKLAHGRLEDDDGRNKAYSCPECKRTLRSKMHLHRHIRDVHGPDIRPYLCDNCGKAFKRTDALKQHKALHESKANRILPHKCTTCGKAFRSLAHLKEHLVIHTSERPYLCQYCGAAFKTQAVQKRHILTLHIKPRAHVCSVCCRQFNTKHALQRHENTHTKAENAQEPAVLVVGTMEDAHNAFDEKEKRTAISNIEAHVSGVTVVMKDEDEGSAHMSIGGQASNTLVHSMIGTASAQTAIEDQIGSESERLQQAYIQGNQDATTLYYFTGDLNSL